MDNFDVSKTPLKAQYSTELPSTAEPKIHEKSDPKSTPVNISASQSGSGFSTSLDPINPQATVNTAALYQKAIGQAPDSPTKLKDIQDNTQNISNYSEPINSSSPIFDDVTKLFIQNTHPEATSFKGLQQGPAAGIEPNIPQHSVSVQQGTMSSISNSRELEIFEYNFDIEYQSTPSTPATSTPAEGSIKGLIVSVIEQKGIIIPQNGHLDKEVIDSVNNELHKIIPTLIPISSIVASPPTSQTSRSKRSTEVKASTVQTKNDSWLSTAKKWLQSLPHEVKLFVFSKPIIRSIYVKKCFSGFKMSEDPTTKLVKHSTLMNSSEARSFKNFLTIDSTECERFLNHINLWEKLFEAFDSKDIEQFQTAKNELNNAHKNFGVSYDVSSNDPNIIAKTKFSKNIAEFFISAENRLKERSGLVDAHSKLLMAYKKNSDVEMKDFETNILTESRYIDAKNLFEYIQKLDEKTITMDKEDFKTILREAPISQDLKNAISRDKLGENLYEVRY